MKRYVILMPFHNPWDWHTDYANQSARILARKHIVVCLLWGDTVSLWEIIRGARSYRPVTGNGNLWKIQPIFLVPGKRFFLSQLINAGLNLPFIFLIVTAISFVTKRERLFWFFGFYDPVFLLLPPFFRSWKTVYDCVDIATHPSHALRRRIEASERSLLGYAWIVVTNSETLATRLTAVRNDVRIVPLGFRIEMFQKPLPAPAIKRRRPLIGYSGSIDYRVNLYLLYRLIRENPRWDFGLFGPVFHDHLTESKQSLIRRLLRQPNVTYGNLETRSLAATLSECDAFIIPYDTDIPLAKYAFPMKIMEYWYAKKPVISTRITELERYPRFVRFASTSRDFTQAIRAALLHPAPRTLRAAHALAKKHTWQRKVVAIMNTMRRYETAQKNP